MAAESASNRGHLDHIIRWDDDMRPGVVPDSENIVLSKAVTNHQFIVTFWITCSATKACDRGRTQRNSIPVAELEVWDGTST